VANAHRAADLKVLLVEDNPAYAMMVREMFREEHDSPVAVTHATRLREALAYLEQQNFSAVLLDLTLPDSEGIDTFMQARARAPWAPIVVLTGLDDEAVAATAVREGAQDYLVKGQVDGRVLYQSVRYAVERYAVTEELRRSEARYRSLIEGSIQGILIHVDGIVRFANPALARTLRISSPDVLLGRTIWSFIAADDRPFVAHLLELRREQPGGQRHFEVRALRADGAKVWLDCIATSIQWDGAPATLATLVDVTDRKRAEASLRISEERFRQLADNVREAFIIAEVPAFRAVYLSRAWSEIWGRPIEDAYADPDVLMDSVHPDDVSIVQNNQRAIVDGHAGTIVFRIRREDGQQRTIRARTFPVFDHSGRVYRTVGLAEDITDLLHTEDQLRQAQKMEAVGRLAGGIAHDFNNLLSVILGFSELVIADLTSEGHPSLPDVQQIQQAGQSAANLTRQLLAFSRRQILQPQILDLNQVLMRVQALLQRVIGEDVTLNVKLTDRLHRISADPGQIEQVVVNLAVNARDAMPGGGRVTIETANIMLDGEFVGQHLGSSLGPHVMLAVTDTGVGMDAETQKRLFEPFFTTKAGQGTGLGLATVYGIVRQSHGTIWVYSEVGVGTTFKVYFPAVEDAVAQPIPSRVQQAPAGGTETLLVVDDQPEVRTVASQILRRSGYTVIEASSGPDALVASREHQGPIQALLTDVIMPGFGGRELATELAAERPEMRPIFMSGYTDDTVLRHGFLDSSLTLIQKPFTPSMLLRKVRDVLDA
jgi:two-component system, cell cycle sensor histidine kinase and response regulator CckA